MADDVLTRNGDGELAVRTVQSTGDNYVNPNDVYTRDSNGNLAVRTVGGSGGGGDQHNLGYYTTQEALEEAHPTAEAGDWAIVGETDTIWIWDTDNSEWVDSHKADSVTSVNGKTGAVVLDAEDVGALPDDTPIPDPQVNSDWNATSGVAEILNKPTIPSTAQQVGAVPQYETMPTADASNADLIVQFVGATDTYTNGYFYKCVSDGQQPATYSWTQTDVQPQPVIPAPLPDQTNKAGMFLQTNGSTAQWSDTRLTHSTTKTFTYDENTMENVLRITPKQNRDCWVRIECWEGLDDGEGGLMKGPQLFTSDLYLSYADLSRQDGNFSSKALITNLSIGNYITFGPCVQAFYDEGGQTVGGFFDIDTFYSYEEEIPSGEERYVIMDIKYSDGVNTFTYPETFEGSPLDYSTGMLLPNPTGIKSGYGNVNCIPMAEYGGQDVIWRRYPFGNVIVNSPFDDNAKTLVTQDGDFALTWASQVRKLPTFDNADEYTVLLDPVAIFQYTGETTNDYTQGYFYKIQYDLDRNAVATQTAGSSLTDITVNQAVFADWIKQEWGYFQGTYEFTFDGSNWSGTYGGEYADLTDMGITYTGTPVADDVIEVTFDEATWTWVQVNVQPDPLPSQTGQSGKFLSTNGTTASWETINALQNQGTIASNLNILGDTGVAQIRTNATSIGYFAAAKNNFSTAIGALASCDYDYAVALGDSAYAAGNHAVAIGANSEVAYGAAHAIQIGATTNTSGPTTNSDANTFKVANENGNFEIMDANGNLPADRIADTTGLTTGNYLPRLTIDAQGNKTITWVAE